jgi:branched-chain amino acid transport system ATP-binding protein
VGLEVRGIDSFYGLSHVLFDVSLSIEEGEAVALLGRNGAGKSTTLKSIMGFVPPQKGSITWQGRDITGRRPDEVARLGIGYVPEDRRIFPHLTVRENLEVARKKDASKDGRAPWTIERVNHLFPQLALLAGRDGGLLSGGEQQMLSIARSLMGNPSVLLLDEPSEGLAPVIIEALGKQILELKQEGMAILLCEQNSFFALDICERALIIEKGSIVWEGLAADLRRSPAVMREHLAVG